MEISYEKLTRLLGEAYDEGYKGCFDLKGQSVEEVLRRFDVRDTDEFRVWGVEELKQMPEGTIFQHIGRGRCWICKRSKGARFMQFERGTPIELVSNTDPWDKPMRLIHRP